MPEHVEALLREGLRDQDVAEITASDERDVPTALVMSVLVSAPHVFTVLADGEPCAIFGVGPSTDDPELGHPWLLGTARLLEVAGEFMRQTPLWVEYMTRVYPHLTNIVSLQNTVSIDWLTRMGFEFGEDVDVNGTPFVEFHNV